MNRRYKSTFTLPFCALALAVAAASGCQPGSLAESSFKDSGRLVLTGSSTIAPLVAQIGRRFEEDHPGTRIDVQTGGSSRGITDATTGVADLGMSSRPLEEGEAAELVELPVAYDGVAFVVHASNRIQEISDEDLRRIYTGQISNWAKLGGASLPITVVNRAAGRSERVLVSEYLNISPADFHEDLVSGENQHAVKTVLGDPSVIVYLSLGAAQREAEAGQPLRLLPLRGVPATVEAVATGVFPLARPLLLLSKGEPKGLAKSFVAFAQSPAVDDLIASLAYVPPRR